MYQGGDDALQALCGKFDSLAANQLSLNVTSFLFIVVDMEVSCEDCGRTYTPNRAKGHRNKTCNSCLVARRRRLREEEIYKYKGNCCSICGYSRAKQALHFHHLIPKEKDFQISGNWGMSWEKVQKELDKCILVCANCHAEIHEGLLKLGC